MLTTSSLSDSTSYLAPRTCPALRPCLPAPRVLSAGLDEAGIEAVNDADADALTRARGPAFRRQLGNMRALTGAQVGRGGGEGGGGQRGVGRGAWRWAGAGAEGSVAWRWVGGGR